MEFVTTREFKMKANKYINKKNEVVITKYGKPVAMLTPIVADSPEELFFKMKSIFIESKVSKKNALLALAEARKDIYG